MTDPAPGAEFRTPNPSLSRIRCDLGVRLVLFARAHMGERGVGFFVTDHWIENGWLWVRLEHVVDYSLLESGSRNMDCGIEAIF